MYTARLAEMQQSKQVLINEIMALVKPFMWASGYSANQSDCIAKGAVREPLFLYTFPPAYNRSEKEYEDTYLLKGELLTAGCEEGFEGFTARGDIITDSYMAICTVSMSLLCLEDVLAIHRVIVDERENRMIRKHKRK